VKRAAAGLGALFVAGAATIAPAYASTTYEGAVKFGYAITTAFTAHITNDYAVGVTSFQQGISNIQTTGSGSCTANSGDTEGPFALSFKTITVSSAGPTACNYQNAIGISVNTNDTNGFNIYESLDATATPSYYGICVTVDHGGTPSSPNTPNSTNNAGGPAVGTFNAASQLTACSAGTLLLPAPAAVTNAGLGGDAALVSAPPAGAYVASGSVPATALYTYATKTSGTVYYGQDVQLNLSTNAPATTAATHAIILYFVPS
jgi:hypothetical protein